MLPEIGHDGQERLLRSKALIIGSGGLGCAQAQLLVRAGLGSLVLVDSDVVEIENVHRQVLFDEEDAKLRRPKAEAAASKLRRVNSEVGIEPMVMKVTADNILELIEGIDVVLDATDNIETRYVINDACVLRNTPWVYGGISGTQGLVMPVLPQSGPCLRCLFPEPPPSSALPTVDVAGVVNTGPPLIGSLQVTAAFRILIGSPADPHLLSIDPWRSSFRRIEVSREPSCRCCAQRSFEFLPVD